MRASFLTGQRPLTHGVFLNDVPLNPEAVTIAKVLRTAGYDTACIGKWHVNGDGRPNFIRPERRQGFDYWKVLECTHDYNHSAYYADGPEKFYWEGYDAIAQTRDAQQYLCDHALAQKPFFLFLAWGPPHDPYLTAPEKYRTLYDPDELTLRPNVPEAERSKARKSLAGYYAHCTALDECIGELAAPCKKAGWRRTRSWSSPPITATCSARKAPTTSNGPGMNPSASRCWCVGQRAWASKPASLTPRLTPKTSCPLCLAYAACRSLRPSRVSTTAAIFSAARTQPTALLSFRALHPLANGSPGRR